MHDSLGQSSGLVGADNVHAAEIFDRSESFDDNLFLGHALGAMSKVDADNRRQQLRGQPTASAREKRKESRTGRARYTLMAKMATTITSVTSMRK